MTADRKPEKKVLIIAYYWPPSGGSGVQRWLKFVKYLPQFGWQPFVFTPENPAFDIKDESLLKDVPPEAEVIRFPIWEPYEMFFKLSSLLGKKTSARPTEVVGGEKISALQKVATWVRGNLMLPDPRRFWVTPSVRFLTDFTKDNNIDVVITTGPPHSLHLIGLQLKQKRAGIKWVADFRDPWSEWGFLDTVKSSAWAKAYHKSLEKKVLINADAVLTITPFYVRQFERLGGRKVHLLSNGFDEDDFAVIEYQSVPQFLIRHVGIVNEKCDPRPFLKAMERLMNRDGDFRKLAKLEFIGDVHSRVKDFVRQRPVLSEGVVFTSHMPHKKLLLEYDRSALLLLVLTGYKDAEGYMPGKLFEYIATGLPILATGPEQGDAAVLLKETGAGRMFHHENADLIEQALSERFNEWRKAGVKRANGAGADKISRRAITSQLSVLLTTLLEE